jgi:hypothetical protein
LIGKNQHGKLNIIALKEILQERQWHVKYNFLFLPIHDIVPGIDSDGFMTAPVYPVGRYANITTDINPIAPDGTGPITGESNE